MKRHLQFHNPTSPKLISRRRSKTPVICGLSYLLFSASPEALQDLIEAQLPEYGRASSLVEAFLENFSWSFRPLDREQIIEELFRVRTDVARTQFLAWAQMKMLAPWTPTIWRSC